MQRTVTIASRNGLHARPAALFVKAAARAPVPVTVSLAGKEEVVASSLLGVLALGARCADEVTLTAVGEGAEAVLAELAALLDSDLDT